MHRGSEVVYVHDPSQYGPMTVTNIGTDGWLECRTFDQDVYHFQPSELEDARWYYITPTVSQAGLPK